MINPGRLRDPAVSSFISESRPCITVCAFMVDGAQATHGGFVQDVIRSIQVWQRCGIRIQLGRFATINDKTLLDHTGWNCAGAQTEKAQQLLAMRGACADTDFVAFYIGAMAGALAGCGGATLANGRPGCVLTNVRSQNTLAHEIGHWLLGPEHANDSSFAMANPGVDAKTNVMWTPSGSITGIPRLTQVQCNRITARLPLCPLTLAQRQRIDAAVRETAMMAPAAAPMAQPPQGIRELLQRDEGEGLEAVVAMGQGLLPVLMMLLSDSDRQVRARAAIALARISGAAAVPALQPLARQDPSPDVRLLTVDALARFTGPAGEPVVIAALMDPSDRVRLVALEGLALLPTQSARMALSMAAIREPDAVLRNLAGRLSMGLRS